MNLEIKIEERIAQVELLSKEDNKVSISIDNNIYDVDVVMLEDGVYSIILDNKSYNAELVKDESNKHYIVNTHYTTIPLEIIDMQSKYIMNRQKGTIQDMQNSISSPMPGKVVKIPVKIGDSLVEGQTVIIIEAMKMQSEYKVHHDCKIKDILVKEGDIIDANQDLIIFE